MGLPVVPRTPANLLISATTSGTRTETVTSGESAFIIAGVTSGGAGVSVSGAGATWTQIRDDSDGTRRTIIFQGTGLTTGSQTVTLSFTNTTTCRWSWVAATGISTLTPDDASDTKITASSTRTSTDTVTSLTTQNNVLVVLAMALSATASTITAPTGFSRITAASSAFVLAYGAFSTGLSASTLTVTYASATASAIGSGASFNGDDQAAGQPMAKKWGGVPHNGFRRRGMW
jgi:hypothetical protein